MHIHIYIQPYKYCSNLIEKLNCNNCIQLKTFITLGSMTFFFDRDSDVTRALGAATQIV